ncbi:TPA: type II toxin-antitoxin system RelE/ParE family toxin [Enterobacter ludwigii]|nr:type II toxin-antitoxin system RelE/ParE family toxin [Enterobacter ludwigii]HDR2600791.1 type II toxin-antitoxin system RelE/ParE family toxin [Enterobacter ludwigii]
MPVVNWREAARNDLLNILTYIAEDNPDAALRLIDDIETRAGTLPDNPGAYRAGREPGTREMVVRKNYIVVYAETPDGVDVLRVLHAARSWPEQPGGAR